MWGETEVRWVVIQEHAQVSDSIRARATPDDHGVESDDPVGAGLYESEEPGSIRGRVFPREVPHEAPVDPHLNRIGVVTVRGVRDYDRMDFVTHRIWPVAADDLPKRNLVVGFTNHFEWVMARVDRCLCRLKVSRCD